jgi:hypothetical protein
MQPQSEKDVVPATAMLTDHSTQTTSLATDFLRGALSTADRTLFACDEVSLYDAVRNLPDASLRGPAVRAYWRLVAAVAQFRFDEQELAWFQQASEPQAVHERAIFEAARAAADARRQESLEAVVRAQHTLSESSLAASSSELPWPVDVPFVGAYRTNFEVLFAERTAPANLQRIHQVLPTTFRVIEVRAHAAAAADEAVGQVMEAYSQGQVPLRSWLEAIDNWRAQREGLLAAVLRYNDQIAEYALAVVGPAADPAMVVSTLIEWERPDPATDFHYDEAVRPAAAIAPLEAEAPKTFVPRDPNPPSAGPVEEEARTNSVLQTPPREPGILPHDQSVLRSIRVEH